MKVISLKVNPCIGCSARTPYCKIDGCELYINYLKEPISKEEEITEEEWIRMKEEAKKMCDKLYGVEL